MKKIIVACLLLFVFAVVDSARAQQEVSLNKEQKQAIENATFTDIQGNQFSLKDFRGKVVMIDFWETWCGPCIRSMPTNDKLVRQFPNKFAVIAVAPGLGDSKDKVVSFINNHHYKFRYSYGSQLAKKLQIMSIPYKVFVDPKGNFIKVMIGSYGEKEDYTQIRSLIDEYTNSSSGAE